jgi:peroxiredoxin/predicted 2-oxoglutarate/Fe(II)-dependent dioxygenase YbiX
VALRIIQVGEPAPWFVCRSPINPHFHFDSVGGRYVVLCFFGSAADPTSRRVLDQVLSCQHVFDDANACFFGVSVDPDDETNCRVQNVIPGFRFLWDFDRSVSRLFGVTLETDDEGARYRRFTLVLDERLRALRILPFGENPDRHVSQLVAFLKELPPITTGDLVGQPAPVLIVPRVFEPELCAMLIDYYDSYGGQESGFMRDVEGKTVEIVDHNFKQRRDQVVRDKRLRVAAMQRIHDRLVPEVHKAFQFHATRIERYIVSCYDSAAGGHFRPHRDNATKGTAHRQFAVSLNLNSQFEGGDLRFPEFGPQTYKAPVGGAVVFSCSLLHEATPITTGKRYAFLPFLYDNEAAKIRQQNLKYLSDSST